MSERNGIYKILRNPAIYTFYQYLVGAPKMHRRFLDECLRLKKGDRILDLGCGPGDFRNYLPDWVEYYGCDPNPAYIAAAKEKLQNAGGGGGGFYEAGVDVFKGLKIPDSIPDCNIVLSMSVLHHLSDKEADLLFCTASEYLLKMKQKTGENKCRFVVFDNCFTEKQNPIARWLIKNDRGKNSRYDKWYESKLYDRFTDINMQYYTDMLRIPYTMFIADCRL